MLGFFNHARFLTMLVFDHAWFFNLARFSTMHLVFSTMLGFFTMLVFSSKVCGASRVRAPTLQPYPREVFVLTFEVSSHV